MVIQAQKAVSKEILKTIEVLGIGNVLEVSCDDTGSETLHVEIDSIELPQYPIVSVKKIEPVWIYVQDEKLPIVYCREDFPIVPHLNVYDNGKKSLCLFDVPYYDIRHLFNASLLLKRIVEWFSLTARGELHQKNQPLEPFFPYVMDKVILTPGFYENIFIRLEKTISSNGSITLKNTDIQSGKGDIYGCVKVVSNNKDRENIINFLPKTLGDLDKAFEDTLIEQISPSVLSLWDIRHYPEKYKKIFNQSLSLLRDCKILLLVKTSAYRDGREEGTFYKFFVISGKLSDLISGLGYKFENKKLVKKGNSDRYKDLQIFPYEIQYSINRKFAQDLNRKLESGENLKYMQIGVGALGSQIANNCIRSGFGEWIYLDDDEFLPHNIARHCLSRKYVCANKADSMVKYADSILFQGESSSYEAIASNMFDDDAQTQIQNIFSKVHMIVDTSASIAVERKIALDYMDVPRCMSLFMNPAGNSLIMLREDKKRFIKLDTLEMQYYRLIVKTESLNKHLQLSEKVLYSTSCRGSSLVFSQDNTSIFSGIGSKVIKQAEAEDYARVCIWYEDGLEIKCLEESGEIFDTIEHGEWIVKISSSVKKELYSLRHAKLPNETGGVLIGSYDFFRKICYIVDILIAPPDSKEYPTAFIRGNKGLKNQIQHIEKVSMGNLYYIGEWHSHPNNNTNASVDDGTLLKSIAEFTNAECNPGVMIIVGEDNFQIYMS